MSPRVAAALLLFAAWSISLYLLLTGSPVLVRPVSPSWNVPVGTLVAWGGLTALPAALLIAKPGWLGHAFAHWMRATLVLAVMWGFVSYGLANNWWFNFGAGSDGFRGSVAAGRVFRLYSLLVFLAPLLIVIGAAVRRLLSAVRRRPDDLR